MKIHILCSDGSPLGVTEKTIWGDGHRIGVGGAELAMLTMCAEWTKAGHEVVLFNNPWEFGASSFEQRHISSFNINEKRDVLIVFRSPNPKSVAVANCLKVWWSCDQYTIGSFAQFAPTVDKIVGISPTHKSYFEKNYGITSMEVIDLPVRIDDYGDIDLSMKKPKKIIWNSVPDRGLDNLWRMFKAIRLAVPDVSVTILSDYRLWGTGANNERHRARWMVHDNFIFKGAVSRKEMIEEQKTASLNLYTCNYEELFCIANAENQVAGIYTISSGAGALFTTNMGTIINVDTNNPHNDRLFIDETVEMLNSSLLIDRQKDVMMDARERFKPEKIIEEWERKIFQ